MSREAPPRLKDDPAVGSLLSSADAGAELAADRLARNGAAVRAAIAERGRDKPFAPWKLAVPIALVLAAVVVGRALLSDGGRADAPAATLDAAPPVADAMIAQAAPPDAAPAPAPDATEVAAAPASAHPERAPAEGGASRRTPATPDAASAETSTLPEQIRLYEEARAAGKRGELALGLDRIDELLRRFPSTQLRADAELTRAELLTRADRLAEAAAAWSELAGGLAHAGRRGEILRTLGDVLRKQGDCAAATDAYTRARAEKLSSREAAKVARGLERCESLKAPAGSGDPSP